MEFVIAIVFIGVVLGPFLVFVARIHDLNSAVGQQGRREAWRSFNDQAVLAGIDPTHAHALATTVNPSVPAVPPLPINSGIVPAVPGLASLVPLQVNVDGTVAEPRMAGAGYQIGAGAAVAPRSTPTAPLAPVIMPIPVVTPGDGTVIAARALAPAAPGSPYTAQVQAASAAGTKVFITFNQPHASAQGLGVAQQTVTAVDLLERVNGTAWTEYAGSGSDRPVTLGDGRTRWLVTRDDGRLQIYEPSPNTTFAYQVGLGAPIIVRGLDENASGTTLSFDYAACSAVATGAMPLRIDFPKTVKTAFGLAWAAQSIGFQWTFKGTAGPFTGDATSFFTPGALPLWADSIAVVAHPVIPAGAAADAGSWTFTRIKLVLGVPRLASTADASGFYAPGQLEFTAPPGPDGNAIGRLSFDNGATLSTGPTLSIAIIP